MIRNKKGFSLIELIMVLSVASAISFMKFQDLKQEQEATEARAVGEQMKQIGEAVNGYISIRYDKLSTLVSATGTGTDPGPRTCSASQCEITYQTLINEGLLPSSYTGINAQKSGYKILLKREGTAPNYVINGLVTTTQPWTEGGKPRYDLLGKAMQSAGVDSGMTKSATVASGYSGQWSEQASNYSNITSTGLLAYRVGYDSSMYSVYLRRDGTLPMTGDLNMGGNNISNAKNITASGTGNFGGDVSSGGNIAAARNVSATGDVIAGHWLTAHNGNGNYLKMGGDSDGNFDFVFDATTARKQVGFFPSDKSAEFIFSFRGNIKVATPDGGKEGVALNGTSGDITASGNIVTVKNVKGATLESTGRVTVGELIQLNGQATAGAACTPNGLQGRDSSGKLLSCASGKWVNGGVSEIVTGMYVSRKPNICVVKNAATGGCSCSSGTNPVQISYTYSETCHGSGNNCTDRSTYVYACTK